MRCRYRTRPMSYAKMTACTRLRSFSLARTLPTCVLTVASDTTSWSAISVLESPAATARSTSRSRGVSWSRTAWGGEPGPRPHHGRGLLGECDQRGQPPADAFRYDLFPGRPDVAPVRPGPDLTAAPACDR